MAYIVADNIFSPLGETTEENFSRLTGMQSGIRKHENSVLSEQPFYAALFDADVFPISNKHTRFEQMLIRSISAALANSTVDPAHAGTALIISTTKGNISLLETNEDSPGLHQQVALTTSAKKLADHFNFVNQPMIVSNACISGLLGLIMGMRLIRNGQYQHVVVAGADEVTWVD